MLCDYVWLCACWLFELTTGCLFAFALNVFTLLAFIIFLCQKSKNTLKNRKSKSLINFVEFCLKACFALYLCTNGLVHLLRSLFPMHLYHCGRNFDIYVTVVNRSSNLLWMISECFFDLETYIDLCLYIFPPFILLFLLKELTKCKSPNEKRYWATKACRTY